MRYIGYDRMSRSSPDRAPALRSHGSMAVAVLMFLSVALLILSRLDHGYIGRLRWQVTEMVMPLLQAALVPFEPVRHAGRAAGEFFTLNSELARLRDENQRLKGWEWRAAELERRLADISATAGAARDPKIPFVTARVIASSSGAFVRSAMINAGKDEGLKSGFPVLGGDGVVGRIVDTGAHAARVLLLTDAQSRIPVLVGADYARAVLSGDNGPQPKLMFADPSLKPQIGDDVSTSGVGGIFPRGLRIGSVVAIEPVVRVAPHADLDGVEYVSILLYDTEAVNLIDTLPSARSAAGLDKRISPGTGGRTQ